MIYEVEKLLNSTVEDDFARAKELKNPSNYHRIVKNLKRKIFGGTYYFFGSRMMGVGKDDSDIDIFISVGEFFFRDQVKVSSLSFKITPTSIRCTQTKLSSSSTCWSGKCVGTLDGE
jgi:predicted nucleotidyltransferase